MSFQEMKELGICIRSQVHKASPVLAKAFVYLQSCAPDFDEKVCNKGLFSEKVFRKKLDKNLDKEINRLMFELSGAIENFIVMKFAMQDKATRTDALLNWYEKKNLDKQAESKFKEIEDELSQNRTMEMIEIHMRYMNGKINQNASKGNFPQYILGCRHYVDLLEENFRYGSLMKVLDIESTESITSDDDLQQIKAGKIKPEFQALSFKEQINIVQHLIDFNRSPDVKGYFQLKGLLASPNVSVYHKIRLLLLMDNHRGKIFSGRQMLEEGVALNKVKIELQTPENKGYMPFITYRNLLISLGELNRIKEALKFEKSTGSKILGVADVKNFKALYHAYVLFYQGDYSSALQIASNCYSEVMPMSIDIGFIKIRLAYKMNDGKMLEAHVNNFRKHVSVFAKKKGIAYMLKSILANVSYTFRLFKIHPSQKSMLQKLKAQVLNNKAFFNNYWILNEIDRKLAEKNGKK